jgi:hypothetical protein
MAMEKGTTVSALWWQDVGGTSCAGGKEEHADGGRERGYPARLFYSPQVDAADSPGEASQPEDDSQGYQ